MTYLGAVLIAALSLVGVIIWTIIKVVNHFL